MSDQALQSLYERVTTWQRKTFPMPDADHAKSLLAHMWKELAEIAAAPHDVEERADMAILAMGYADRTHRDAPSCWGDYSWGYDSPLEAIRALSFDLGDVQVRNTHLRLTQFLARCTMGTGLNCQQFIDAISAKMDKNEARRWPAPSEQVPGQPVEHVREPVTDLATILSILDAHPGESAVEAARRVREELRVMCESHRVLGERLGKIIVDANPGAALAPGEEAPQ